MRNILPCGGAHRYRGSARMSARRPIAAALLLALAGCAAPLPRGFYRPEGQAPQDSIGVYVEQGAEALIEARCQGAYIDRRGPASAPARCTSSSTWRAAQRRHLARAQLDHGGRQARHGRPARAAAARARPGRAATAWPATCSCRAGRAGPSTSSSTTPGCWPDGPPPVILLVWELQRRRPRRPRPVRVHAHPRRRPVLARKLPAAETDFGLRNGYYLPGVQLGERRLRKADEERLHHLFHEEEGWMW
jgi:hypothetical protein